MHAQFRDKPGRAKVFEHKFALVHRKRPNVNIPLENWDVAIRPGADIVMAIQMLNIALNGNSCPRKSCSGVPGPDLNVRGMLLW